jgi:hypothetical protein
VSVVDDLVQCSAVTHLVKRESRQLFGRGIHKDAVLVLVEDEEGRRRVVGDRLGEVVLLRQDFVDRRDGVEAVFVALIGHEGVDLAAAQGADELVDLVKVGQLGEGHQLVPASVLDDDRVHLAAL